MSKTKQIRQALIHVDLTMVRDALRLPENVEILLAVPPTRAHLENNTVTLLLEGDRFTALEPGDHVPQVIAKFRGTDIRGGEFKFDSFEQVQD